LTAGNKGAKNSEVRFYDLCAFCIELHAFRVGGERPAGRAGILVAKLRSPNADASNLKQYILSNIFEQWAAANPAPASAYAQTNPEDEFRVAALIPVIQEVAQSDPPAAAALVPQLTVASLENVAAKIASEWHHWIRWWLPPGCCSFARGEARTYAIHTVHERWAYRDPDPAEAWYQSLPAADRDASGHGPGFWKIRGVRGRYFGGAGSVTGAGSGAGSGGGGFTFQSLDGTSLMKSATKPRT
jgi:hypothetical protein